jgi:uncharacterized YigZ family protein
MLVVPLETVRREIRVVNSRFIATLAPTDSVELARAFIQAIRAEFADASHHVPAFIIGGGNTLTEFCSDDGEPAGTSGRPLLAVLKGSGLGNVAVVVTRWFGGTLLGTGGLVKAYSGAGKAVTGAVKRAEVLPGRRIGLALPYHLFERARQALDAAGATVTREDFGTAVELLAELTDEALPAFSARIADLGAGSIVIRILDTVLVRRELKS